MVGRKGRGGGSSIVDEATHLPGASCVYLNSASVQVNVAFDAILDNSQPLLSNCKPIGLKVEGLGFKG